MAQQKGVFDVAEVKVASLQSRDGDGVLAGVMEIRNDCGVYTCSYMGRSRSNTNVALLFPSLFVLTGTRMGLLHSATD